MFLKANDKVNSYNTIILGMVILKDNSPLVLDLFLDDIKKTYGDELSEVSGDEMAVAFKIKGELVAIGSMSMPIPMKEIEETAKYAYNWPNVIEEVKDHKGHLIVTVMQGSSDTIKRYKIFTS